MPPVKNCFLVFKTGAGKPGAAAFGECNTRQNDHNQTEIVDYGEKEKALKDFVQKTDMDFQAAQMGGSQMGNMQAMAAQIQSMSADQRQAYAQQIAAQMQANAQQPMSGPDNPQNAKLAMQAYSLATTQMAPLTNELAAKVRDLQDKEKKEEDALKQPDIAAQCPGMKPVGLPSCSCANGLEKSYWVQILAIRDSYASQKNQLVQQYLTKLISLATAIDDDVVKLKYGDALNNPQYKKMLVSAQSGAFGNLLAIPESIAEDARHAGADAYVNTKNAGDGVYFLGCQR